MMVIERRLRIALFLLENGPTHCADIWRTLNIPRGCIYTALRYPYLFAQLPDSRWYCIYGTDNSDLRQKQGPRG
jgi:hypothetical protein